MRVKAYALEAQADLDPWVFLQWNRQTRLVRMACTRSGDIWVLGDVAVGGLEEKDLDRLLGLVAEGVLAVRGYAKALTEPPPAKPTGWIAPRG